MATVTMDQSEYKALMDVQSQLEKRIEDNKALQSELNQLKEDEISYLEKSKRQVLVVKKVATYPINHEEVSNIAVRAAVRSTGIGRSQSSTIEKYLIDYLTSFYEQAAENAYFNIDNKCVELGTEMTFKGLGKIKEEIESIVRSEYEKDEEKLMSKKEYIEDKHNTVAKLNKKISRLESELKEVSFSHDIDKRESLKDVEREVEKLKSNIDSLVTSLSNKDEIISEVSELNDKYIRALYDITDKVIPNAEKIGFWNWNSQKGAILGGLKYIENITGLNTK